MDFISIILIAIGLSMDAFAVSVSNGIVLKKVTALNSIKTGVFFGAFQAFMPILGWFLGNTFCMYIESIDHWLAFGLLSFIGANMIYESLKEEENEYRNPNSTKVLLVMAIATSIDALAVGVSFSMLQANIFIPAIVIGTITFIISSIGVFIGKKVGKLFKKNAEIFGGIILIIIGFNILMHHM